MKFITVFLSIFSIAIFLSVQIPPNETYWYLGFLSPAIPTALIIILILLIYNGSKKSLFVLFPLIALIFGFKFIPRTISLSFSGNTEENYFRLLSYNVSGFEQGNIEGETGENKLMQWIIVEDADIYALQEFSNDDNSDVKNFVTQLRQSHPYYNFSSVRDQGSFGVAIFSKHPIINEGELIFGGKKFNRAAYADIVIAEDTARIISIHMESMQLKRAQGLGDSKKEKVKQSLQYGYYKMKEAMIERSYQADTVLSFIQASPYPVIIAGDFNHTPYSYVYNEFSRNMKNAFTKKGNGFGFTYAGSKLFFLRIDHQFYDDSGFDLLKFENFNDEVLSDHHPIEGYYQFK